MGVGRELIREYATAWVVGLTDITPTVRKAAALLQAGRAAEAQRLLPPERPFPLEPGIARRLNAS